MSDIESTMRTYKKHSAHFETKMSMDGLWTVGTSVWYGCGVWNGWVIWGFGTVSNNIMAISYFLNYWLLYNKNSETPMTSITVR